MRIRIPEQLAKALAAGQVMAILGWGYPDFAPRPQAGQDIGSPRPSPTACESWLQNCAPHVHYLHHAIAQTPVQCILSLTPDPAFQKVLELYDHEWVTLARDQEQLPPGGRLHIPLGGSSHDPENVLLSERDFLTVESERAILWQHARGYAGRFPLLVLGVDPDSRVIQRLLSELRPIPPFSAAGWIFVHAIDTKSREAWEDVGFEVLEGNPAIWLRDLVRVGPLHHSFSTITDINIRHQLSPYKNLNYFERSEASWFFGRETEKQRLIDLVCAHRLTVLTGASGSGKTSLVNAGLLAWSDRIPDQLGIYVRIGDDPISAIRNVLAEHLKIKGWFKKNDQPLPDLLARAVTSRNVTPLIVLDQGEELFTRTGDHLRTAFLIALRDCVTAPTLLARFVISLREDYLPRLAEFRENFPSLLQNVFYLSELDHDAAMEAMCGPARRFGIEFEQTLADQILKEIGIHNFAPTQIQIICSRLFDARDGNSIRADTYKNIGGAEEILRDFLTGQMRSLDKDQEHARIVLKSMVTSEGTKDVLTLTEIASRTRLDPGRVHSLLLRLRDNCRLLRTIHVERELRFELAHEYLTSEIWSWMTDADIKIREMEDLLGRELRSWRRFRQLRLGVDRLKIFEQNQQVLETSTESLTLLLLSAIKHGRSATVWLLRIRTLPNEAQNKIADDLFNYFQDRDRMQRIEAAEAISELTPAPILHALESASAVIRRAALEMVGGMEMKEALPKTIDLLRDPDPEVRVLACGALGEIGGREAVAALRQAADSQDIQLASAAIRALGRTGEFSALPLILSSLSSDIPERINAAKEAILQNSPKVAVSLLLSNSISKVAKERLWDYITQDINPHKFIELIELRREDLLDSDLEKILVTFTLSSEFLIWARSRGGSIGEMAKEKLDTRQSTMQRARTRVLERLRNDYSINQIAELFADDNIEVVWATARHIAADNALLQMILPQLLHSNNPTLWGGILYTVFIAEAASLLEKESLIAGLKQLDPTARYYACLIAESMHNSEIIDLELIDQLKSLASDNAKPRWYQHRYGRRVRDASEAALARLAPRSKVWRKSFQVTFSSDKAK